MASKCFDILAPIFSEQMPLVGWSAGDVKKLRQLARAGLTTRWAAVKLGRTLASVAQKASIEGISFKPKSMTNPAGAAVVNAIGPIRQVVRGEYKVQRRYLVIVPGTVGSLGAPVQVQSE